MTNLSEVHNSISSAANQRWGNEAGAPDSVTCHGASSWFVPPIIVPLFLVAVIFARALYVAYS